jgi:hypothetical protein
MIFDLYQDEYFEIKIEPVPEYGHFLHVQVDEWTAEVYKHGLVVWEQIKEALRNEGIKELGALIHQDNENLLKFADLFGWTDTQYRAESYEIWQYNLEESWDQLQQQS